MSLQLVSFDTDRVKDYLFATSVLGDIREASALLDNLNRKIGETIREICPGLSPDDVIYAAGGSALVLLPDDATAKRAVRAIEAFYRGATITASITGVHIPMSPEDLRQRFGEKVRQAGFLLRQRKAEKGNPRTLPAAPYMRFCDACGCLPAAHRDRERDELVCRACWIKRAHRGEARRTLWDRLIQVTEPHRGTPVAPAGWDDLLARTVGNVDYRLHRRPDDFSSIAASSRRPGYIALIYADGNNMGRIVQGLETPRSYRSLAHGVDDLLARVTYCSLMKQVREHPGRPLFELLMAGGDDLMLVCAADCAFPVALDLAEGFEKYSSPLVESLGAKSQAISLSVGVVVAREDFPIAAMRDLATSLQRRAKRRSFEADGEGAIDFMVVTGPGSQNVDRIREEVLTEKGFVLRPREGRYLLTRRPYLASELRRLLDDAMLLKGAGFPPGQLQTMFEAVFESSNQASLAAVQALGRLRAEPRRMLLEFFRHGGCDILYPWRKANGYRDTALVDLVEIYPFV
ncbi:MAG: hypothetical protein AB1503_11330 [Bacillota bacterium]